MSTAETEEEIARQQECRDAFIAREVGEVLDEMLNESLYWHIPNGEPAPLWVEMRGAILAKVFAIEHEMGRQELNAEQVRDNCL